MHHARVHAQAVSRAAQRIARELELKSVDELIVVALLHDVGKLVLGHARGGVLNAPDTRTATPETRIQHERRATGLDHPSLGALLLRRWKLPDRLSDAVARHHQAEEGRDLATLVRLADMVAHHAHGDAVDRALMLRVAEACRLPVTALRDALFDLPHSGGSERRRAEPSPLSTRETAIVRRLAEGKLYKEIARDLGLSNSTVRTHLHNAYSKLQVADRAQAVLLATEMGWI
jgi:putative nucleotidyltransferase with HDIG domain